MKAIIWTKYNSIDGLQLRDVPKPQPKPNELLVKIHATTLTAGDYEIRTQQFPLWLLIPLRIYMGIIQPRNVVLGQEFSGEIEALGQDVTQYNIGDAVIGTTGPGMGAHAEYIKVSAQSNEGVLTRKPASISYEEATAIPVGGLEALYFMRKANIQPNDKVLIVGAGGSIGSFAIQLAKHFGAEVTGVDNTNKQELMQSIGADHVIDYTQEDFTKRDETYDVIFDVIGKSHFSGSLSKLKSHGRYVLANPSATDVIRGMFVSATSDKRVVIGQVNQREEDLKYLLQLIESDVLQVVIDKCYSLEQVPDAHHYVATEGKKGNVVINTNNDAKYKKER